MSEEKSNANLVRLLEEISAAPTAADAQNLFEGADHLFIKMDPTQREAAYSKIEDAIRQKSK